MIINRVDPFDESIYLIVRACEDTKYIIDVSFPKKWSNWGKPVAGYRPGSH